MYCKKIQGRKKIKFYKFGKSILLFNNKNLENRKEISLINLKVLNSEIKGINRLRIVLDLAREYGLEKKHQKSGFLKDCIEFLGHNIEGSKIYPSSLKSQAALNFSELENMKQEQSYLGLTDYFRKFVSV